MSPILPGIESSPHLPLSASPAKPLSAAELKEWLRARPQFCVVRAEPHGVRIVNVKGFALTQGHATEELAIRELYHSELGQASRPYVPKPRRSGRLTHIAGAFMGLLTLR